MRSWNSVVLPVCVFLAMLVCYQAVLDGWQSGRAYAALNRLLVAPAAKLRLVAFEPPCNAADLPADDLARARAAFADSLANPTYAGAPAYGAGLLSLVTCDLQPATDAFRNATTGHAALAGFQLGMALYRSGDRSAAKAAWQRSATESLLRVRAHAAVAAGRPNEAVGPLTILADLHPDQPRSWLDLGEVSLNQQDWTVALAHYQHVLQLDPRNLDARYMLGYTAYYGRGDTSQARAALQIVLDSSSATDGQISTASVLMARMATAEGRADEALDWYRRALTLRGALHLFPLREMADVYRSQGHFDQAIAALQEGLREVPSDPSALIQLGRLLIETGQPDEAIPYLRRATNVAPGDLSARSALAEALERAGRPAELNRDVSP